MRLLIRIAIFFYVFVICLVGIAALFFLAHVTDLGAYQSFLQFVYEDPQAGTIAAVVVAATMLISFAFAKIIYGRQEKERTISFDNPLGRVTISLAALEDLVRRVVVRSPQVKEIRPVITSTKKGLLVEIRLVLHSEAHIPDLTSTLQEMIKRRIQDVIGRDERIVIRVQVAKISTDVLKGRKSHERDLDDEDVQSPLHFHGYRA